MSLPEMICIMAWESSAWRTDSWFDFGLEDVFGSVFYILKAVLGGINRN
jgi:hypothetical protein